MIILLNPWAAVVDSFYWQLVADCNLSASRSDPAMLHLPAEVQMMIMENVDDYDAMVSLYDSLPSTCAAARETLLTQILNLLRERNAKDADTLRQCRDAVHEMRDLLGVEVLCFTFRSMIESIDNQIDALEDGIQFRGLRHPKQSRTMLKKNNMLATSTTLGQKSLRRGQNDPIGGRSGQNSKPDNTTSKPMWMNEAGQVCLKHFVDTLYSMQLELPFTLPID